MKHQQRIVDELKMQPGLSDRELTDLILHAGAAQQAINQQCRALATQGVLSRRTRADGRIGNYLIREVTLSEQPPAVSQPAPEDDALSEDRIKRALVDYLAKQGWTSAVAWAKKPGIDIDSSRGSERWIIEVKGRGSRDAMRVNYFIAILGETLQRMSDPQARYSIALPDLAQFRRLWERLPALAKERAQICALFVDAQGNVSEA